MVNNLKIDLETKGSFSQGEAVLVYLPEQPGLEDTGFYSGNFKNLVVLKSPLPGTEGLEEYTTSLIAEIKELDVKRATIVGVRGGGVLAQAITLADRKLCRRLVLVNSSTRLEPGRFQSAIDFIEKTLPFGLPLRLSTDEFDSRSYAHRIDCPSLVVTCSDSTSYERRQARLFQNILPNVWHIRCESPLYKGHRNISGTVTKLVEEFTKIPPRRPQKNIPPGDNVSQLFQQG